MKPTEKSAVASPLRWPLQRVQASLRDGLVALLSRDNGPSIDYDHPPGDPGLFGPNTVTWKIHGDFPGMMAGGVCALMLQTLHPQALAGVWDHSNFREDLMGRLRRTTAFVAGTSYAPKAQAERLIAMVQRIHGKVRGVTADGLPYSADDPELLVWVHVTEMWSFLAGYERYHALRLPEAERDRYFRETSRLAEAMGASRVPKSAAGVDAYFRRVLPRLRHDERSAVVLGVLESVKLPVPGGALFREVFIGAGAALLPEWANQMMGRSRLQRLKAQASARSLMLAGPVLRAALSEGVVMRSRRRMGLGPVPSP